MLGWRAVDGASRWHGLVIRDQPQPYCLMPSDRCSLPQGVPSPTSSNRSNRKSPSNSQFGSGGTPISKKGHEDCQLARRESIQKPRVDAGQKKRYELTKSYARLLDTLPASTSTGSTSKIMLLDCGRDLRRFFLLLSYQFPYS